MSFLRNFLGNIGRREHALSHYAEKRKFLFIVLSHCPYLSDVIFSLGLLDCYERTCLRKIKKHVFYINDPVCHHSPYNHRGLEKILRFCGAMPKLKFEKENNDIDLYLNAKTLRNSETAKRRRNAMGDGETRYSYKTMFVMNKRFVQSDLIRTICSNRVKNV